jgi:hypothetical protein
VPRWALSKPGEEDGIGPVGTLGQGAGIGRGTWLGGTIVCPHAVPLVVEQDSRRSTVGTVDAGTTVNLVKWRSGAAEIGLRTTGFSEMDGLPFLLESVPRDCRIRER